MTHVSSLGCLIAAAGLFLSVACSGEGAGDGASNANDDAAGAMSGSTISGQVTIAGNDGRGIANVTVCSTPFANPCAETDQDGRYELKDLPTGELVDMVFFHDSFVTSRHGIEAVRARVSLDTSLVPVSAMSHAIESSFDTSGAIIFKASVVASAEKLPMANAVIDMGEGEVCYFGASGNMDAQLQATTDSGFAIVNGMRPGEHHLVADELFDADCGFWALEQGRIVADEMTVRIVAGTTTTVTVFCNAPMS